MWRRGACFAAVAAAIPLAYAALPFASIVRQHAAKYGFDPLLVHAVIQQESRHNPKICSGVGACGLMQLMPATARELGVSAQERFDPNKNVAAGTRYLKQLHTMFGNTPDALRAYNWGMGRMRTYLRRKKSGQNPKMPKEAFEYAPRIAWHYYSYGGKGNMFAGLTPMSPKGRWQDNSGKKSGGAAATGNPNRSRTEEALRNTAKTCPQPKIPEPPQLGGAEVVLTVPAVTGGGAGTPVIDPAKVVKWVETVAESKKQLEILKGQYDALTKGMAGLNLLQNVAAISGYEIPNPYSDNGALPQWGKSFDGNLYRQLVEMKAADTGVYANGELKGNAYTHAKAINHAYAEAEVAWAKTNCSVSNLETLITAAGKTQSVKQAKDIQNAIDIETGILAAGQAGIRANMLSMRGNYRSFKLTAQQSYSEYVRK